MIELDIAHKDGACSFQWKHSPENARERLDSLNLIMDTKDFEYLKPNYVL